VSAPTTPSTWNSGTALSLWYGARYDGVEHYCATQGITGMKAAQRIMISTLPLIFTAEWAPGIVNSRSNLSADGIYGPLTARATLRMLEDMDAPGAVNDAVASEYARLMAMDRGGGTLPGGAGVGQPLSQETCAVLLWIAFHRNLPWASLGFPSMAPPRWRTALPGDGPNANLSTCWNAANPPPSADTASRSTPAGSTGTSGTAPSGTTNEPTITPAASRGLSTGAKVGIGAALLAAATPEGRKFLRTIFR
jgi:hypothetical protein